MATSPASNNATPLVVTWSPTHIVTEVGQGAYYKDISWSGTPFGNYEQPQGPNTRIIAPAPGSLYGNAVGKVMVQQTGPSLEPNYPPEQMIYERPQFVPGKGWVSTANTPAA